MYFLSVIFVSIGVVKNDAQTPVISHCVISTQIFLLLASFSLLLLLLAQETSAAPRPRPAPFTPGLKIGALAGAALVIKGEAKN